MERVSWLNAIQFCNKLSDKEGKKPFYEIDGGDVRVPDWNGQGYRLPTEAEWEYACRANAPTPTRYSFGDDAEDLGDYGWFSGNSDRTHPVGQKRPNGFGLFDMHGNVAEWCWDWYREGYYNQSPADDPTGPATASGRVFRGGSWDQLPRSPGRRAAPRGDAGPPVLQPGLPPGPGSVWPLSSGGQGASGAGSPRPGWRHGGAVGRSPAGRGRSEPGGVGLGSGTSGPRAQCLEYG